MYNEELKKTYIKKNEYINLNLETVMTKLFDELEPIEIELNKDASNFTIFEILSFYKSLCTASLERLLVMNSQMSKYTSYCLGNSLVKDNQNHYEEIDNEILLQCVNLAKAKDQIISREELLNEIYQLPNPSDQFLILGLFEGISGQKNSDFFDLNMKNFSGNKVILPTRELIVSDKLVSLAEESASEYTYYAYKANGDFRELNYLSTDANIIKQMYNAKEDTEAVKRQRIYNKLTRTKKYLGRECYTRSALLESGRIEMIKNLMTGNNVENLDETIRKHQDDIAHRYGRIYSIPRYILKYKEYFIN